METKFRLEDGPDPGTCALVFGGELDGARVAEVRYRVEDALVSGKRRVVVDLGAVTYMETAALTALLDANARIARFGGSLFVVSPLDSRVRLVFSVTHLDNVLRVVESRDEALRAA